MGFIVISFFHAVKSGLVFYSLLLTVIRKFTMGMSTEQLPRVGIRQTHQRGDKTNEEKHKSFASPSFQNIEKLQLVVEL